jgi:hypothetical protein
MARKMLLHSGPMLLFCAGDCLLIDSSESFISKVANS